MAQRESRRSREILNKLKGHGGFWFKIWGNEHMMAGLPDIIGCYKGRFVGLEVKHPETLDDTSARQILVHNKIKAAGGIAEVVCSPDEAIVLLMAMIDQSE